jgi:glycosyltransferase involved in cell wall biosynthesis
LESIASQTYANIEVIAVDNESNDGTFSILTEAGVRVIVARSSMSQARNIGASQSRGDYLFHIDSDMELSPNTVEECVAVCLLSQAEAIIVPEVSIGQGYWSRCMALGKTLAQNTKGYEGVRFVTRSAFESVRGYDTNLVAGEDFDFYRRLVARDSHVARANSTIRHHVGTMTLRGTVAKYRFYAKTVGAYRAKYADEPPFATPITYVLRQKRNTLAGDPLHAIGYLFLVILAYVIQK